jgi:ribosome maturation factor RimP
LHLSRPFGYSARRVSPKGGRKPTFFIDGIMRDDKEQTLAEVERLAREIASTLGLEIVEFVFHSQGKHSLLRIDIDRVGMPGVGIAECELLSRTLGERIEALAFFEAPYDLQVSSPGIDRPIRTDDDLRRNAGRPVWLEFRDASDKVQELRGTLADTQGADSVTINGEQGETRIARDRIVLMKQDVTLGRRKRKGA